MTFGPLPCDSNTRRFQLLFFSCTQGPVIIASSQGGVNIEDVAAESPDAITYEPIDIKQGITDEQVRRVTAKVCVNYISCRYHNYVEVHKNFVVANLNFKIFFQLLNFLFLLLQIGLEGEEAVDMIKKMYQLFLEKDALLIEINPYAEDAITGKCMY